MTRIEMDALKILKRPQRCSWLGEKLWGKMYRDRQHYCRPAGKLIQRLARRGLVREVYIDGFRGFIATDADGR